MACKSALARTSRGNCHKVEERLILGWAAKSAGPVSLQILDNAPLAGLSKQKPRLET
jgi:hypothetical protein